MLKISAVVAVHNAEKTLQTVLNHFHENQIEVHIIDHGSSDRTPHIVEAEIGRAVRSSTRYPFDGIYRWKQLLSLKDRIVRELGSDWVIHADGDEVMESPVEGESLREMIVRQNALGYDVIDCDEFVFVPRSEGYYPSDFVKGLTQYYHFSPPGRTLHRLQRNGNMVKPWSTGAGHRLQTEPGKVAPERVRLRHYMGLSMDHLRSQYLSRVFDGRELADRWHLNRVPITPEFIQRPPAERLFDLTRDGWTTSRPETNHLLFYQPHRYSPPKAIPRVADCVPFPIVVGVGRSGTTLLRLMIDAHPEIAITPETHWLRKALRQLTSDPSAFGQARNLIEADPSWPDMGFSQSDLDGIWQQYDMSKPMDTIRKIYRAYAERRGASRSGDKTPLHGLAMHEIASALPEAHFIHIIRDGRDVAVSYRDLWFGPGTDSREAAIFWMWRIREMRQQAQFVPNYLEIRYEELIRAPERTLRIIADFISLPFDQRQLQAHLSAENRLKELRDVTRNGKIISSVQRRSIHALTSKQPDEGRIGRWKQEMAKDEIELFQGVAGNMLLDLGYELG